MNSEPVGSSKSSNNKQKNEKQIVLSTAYASHKHCLLCTNTIGLRIVKPESIMYAYLTSLEKTLELDTEHFKLLCIIFIYRKKYFISVFEFENYAFFVDDLKSDDVPLITPGKFRDGKDFCALNICSALYYLL